MSRKKKIVVATEEEVARYSGDRPKDSGESEVPVEAESVSASEPEEEKPSVSEDWKEKFLRAKAELANFQRRSTKDRQDALKYANSDLVRALLPVLDDLQRVVENGVTANSAESVVDGVKLTIENFLKVLGQFHTSRIDAAEKPFDPEVHEAMMEQPSPDHDERTVLQVVADGYRLHDRVLRPAKVIVSKVSEPQAADSSERDEQAE